MSQSQPRQNFHEESEAGINRQINMELYASYTYQSMVSEAEGRHLGFFSRPPSIISVTIILISIDIKLLAYDK